MLRVLLAATALAAWSVAPAARALPERPLSVAAAANLKPAMEELARAFEAATPGARVTITAGASGAFFAQIRNGAPFDVFFSADREYPRKLVEAGLGGPEVVYAIGKLVLWTPAGSAVDPEREGLRVLADPAVRRIAIANPAIAPYGRAAVAALESAGVHAATKDRLVFGQSVAQVAQFAASGAADAALIPHSLALMPALAGGRIFPVPPAAYPRLEQSALVLAGAADRPLGEAFLAFVAGPAGRAILLRSGYDVP
jgi:molybdate transport system substrate-binding protein